MKKGVPVYAPHRYRICRGTSTYYFTKLCKNKNNKVDDDEDDDANADGDDDDVGVVAFD